MGAEELGRRLLAEVEGGGVRMDELLRQLQSWAASASPGSSRFGIKRMDDLLNERTCNNQPNLTQKHPIIELTSSTSNAGKTHLLYLVVCLAVLPSQWRGLNLLGKDAAIVVLDTDGRFDVLRLASVIRSHIVSAYDSALREQVDYKASFGIPGSVLAEDALESLITTALAHVHILKPQTLPSLVNCLQNIPGYLFDKTAHLSSHRALHSVIIDSISAFYWQQRASDESARLEPTTTCTTNIGGEAKGEKSTQELYRDLRLALRTLQQTFSCSIVYTSTSFATKPTQRGPNEGLVQTTIPGLQPTLRLKMRRDTLPSFPLRMSVEEAGEEEKEWQQAVQKRWGQAFRKGGFNVRDEESGRELRFRIGDGGARVEESWERAGPTIEASMQGKKWYIGVEHGNEGTEGYFYNERGVGLLLEM